MGERYVNLSTISFPVVFDISMSPELNLTKLNKLGFENTVFYYTGVNGYENISYDWCGRFENGTIANNTIGKVPLQTISY